MIYQYFNGPIMKLTQEILLLDGPKKGGADIWGLAKWGN